MHFEEETFCPDQVVCFLQVQHYRHCVLPVVKRSLDAVLKANYVVHRPSFLAEAALHWGQQPVLLQEPR